MRCANILAAGAALIACLLAPWTAQAAPATPAAAALCASCHGAQGQGSEAGVPRLAGQGEAYLQHALASFRSGARSSPVMQPIAGSLSETDVQALAGYFAALRGVPGAEAAPPDAALVRAGETLARVGAALDPTPASMTAVAARLDETQIRQVAAYLSTRPRP